MGELLTVRWVIVCVFIVIVCTIVASVSFHSVSKNKLKWRKMKDLV